MVIVFNNRLRPLWNEACIRYKIIKTFLGILVFIFFFHFLRILWTEKYFVIRQAGLTGWWHAQEASVTSHLELVPEIITHFKVTWANAPIGCYICILDDELYHSNVCYVAKTSCYVIVPFVTRKRLRGNKCSNAFYMAKQNCEKTI